MSPSDDKASALGTQGRRLLCERCLRPAATCICQWIRPTHNETDVLVLQHPLEAKQAKGSARLLELSLGHCTRLVGEQIDEATLSAALARSGPSGEAVVNLLLYPDTQAAPAQAAAEPSRTLPADRQRQRLVVIDATWHKSLKMVLRHPVLQALPRIALAPEAPSRYEGFRKAPRAGQLSTLEATCHALALLEASEERYEPLLQAFEGFCGALRTAPLRKRG